MCFAVLLLYARDKFLALMSVTNREVDCRIGIVNKQTLIAGVEINFRNASSVQSIA